MNNTLRNTIQAASALPIEESRLPVLNQLTDYIKRKIDSKEPVRLNFICTHNSRRSQMSQIWAQAAAQFYHIPINSYSGGVEVTAFNERAVASCQRMGFEINKEGDSANPHYTVQTDKDTELLCFSKTFDDPSNPSTGFAAIMTCSDADENCPFIPGAEARIPLRYEDPKAFDNTDLEQEKYDERNLQIASELLFVFRRLSET